jgi:hypothetical protein
VLRVSAFPVIPQAITTAIIELSSDHACSKAIELIESSEKARITVL